MVVFKITSSESTEINIHIPIAKKSGLAPTFFKDVKLRLVPIKKSTNVNATLEADTI